MVWQENVEQIVMLTNLMEGTKVICVTQYYLVFETYTEFVYFWGVLGGGLIFSSFITFFLVVGKMCAVLARFRPKFKY